MDFEVLRKCFSLWETTCVPFRPRFLLILCHRWACALAPFRLWSPCRCSKDDLCFVICQGPQRPKFMCYSDHSWRLPAGVFGEMKMNAAELQPAFTQFSFDDTLGFPGEGPSAVLPECMTFLSANIGSFRTNGSWKTWNADVCCLQETRIGKANLRSTQNSVKALGQRIVTSDPLPVKWHKSGSITPCGGTAIIGPEALIQPFDPSHDHTGLYSLLFRTQRMNAAWVQVTPSCKVLVISIYACTGASQDQTIHARNDQMLSDVFTFVTQFGPIPVLIAGDLQADPASYSAVANCAAFHGWFDPVQCVDDSGHTSRPLTYSRDGTFSGSEDATSSIDAILVNSPAFFALKSAEVVPVIGKQHRPIKLVFQWKSIQQVGYTLLKSAPFLPDSLKPAVWDESATSDWSCFSERFDSSDDSEVKWTTINEFLVHSLRSQGAQWGHGPHTRGAAPVFIPKRVVPKQHRNSCAATKKSTALFKLVGRLQELFCRLSRAPGGPQDQFDTSQTAFRAFKGLEQHGAPVSWSHPNFPTLAEVFVARQWAEAAAALLDTQIRTNRLRNWKNKIKESAKGNCHYIYQHLRNCAQDEPPNLVLDNEGQVLFQPNLALDQINVAWDDIYSANVLCERPLKILETVWPCIRDQVHQCDLPPIQGRQLFDTIHRRKSHAAPGLDGWRTIELQALPAPCFEPIAKFFTFIEQSDQPLPDALVCAKQCILNKKGPASALNKRIITVLPALLLAYTGSRYRQLQPWLLASLPPAILGGVQDRHMASLYNEVRLELDIAQTDASPVIGVKLDKSKAFDRIVPAYAAMLMLAFGLPRTLVNVFLKLYQRLHRHMAYRCWVRPIATTAANGVAQGCSLSLLAMNMYNKVWYHLLDHLPSVSARAFVDDSYLWCKLNRIHDLRTAIQITQYWDQLVGQLFNPDKSSMWSSHTSGRKQLRAVFPDFPVELEFEVLGTKMYTCSRKAFQYELGVHKQILADIARIGALRIPGKIKNLLFGAKIIARISFGSHVTQIPKRELGQIQNAIIRAMWNGKPKWRAKWLVQAIHGQPHRTDPEIACAVTTIYEFVRCCQKTPALIPLIRRAQTAAHMQPHSLWSRLQHACSVLRVDITPNLGFSFHGSRPFALEKLQPRELKPLLVQLAKQAAYQNVDFRTRKDFVQPQGLLDFRTTTKLLLDETATVGSTITLARRFHSVVVGCVLTNDRLSAAGWVDSSQCRFCSQAKECMSHLVYECTALHSLIGKPTLHELGSNFALMGILEQPWFLARRRLLCSIPPSIFQPFQFERIAEFWTDASVLWAERFWLTIATFAVVDDNLQICKKGIVNYPALNSYVAELWGLLQACLLTPFRVHTYCDNQTVVHHATQVFQSGTADESWMCQEWWRCLCELTRTRKQLHPCPFQVTWIPAHCFEHLPIADVTPTMAASKHTTVRNIERNRVADLTAKELASTLSAVHPQMQHEADRAALHHHKWLATLHELLPTTCPSLTVDPPEHVQNFAMEHYRELFPLWSWNVDCRLFTWKPKIPTDFQKPSSWEGSPHEWRVVCTFLRNLRWRVDATEVTSFCELTTLFHHLGYAFDERDLSPTYLDYHKKIRRAIVLLDRSAEVQVMPGTITASLAKAAGRTMPQGSIVGAAVFADNDALVHLARVFECGAGRTLASWDVSLL